MPLKPTELGERLHIDLRSGVAGIDKWRGVRREGDPASIDDSQTWYQENTRLVGGKILSRGGQAAVNTVAANGCIDGFFDAGDMGAQNPSTYVSPGFYVINGSNGRPSQIETDGTFTEVVAESMTHIANYGDYVYYRSTETQFKRFELGASSSANTFSITKIDANDEGATVGGTANGYLWIIYGYHETLTPSNGRIYQWDGTTATSVHSFSYADTSSEVTFGDDNWRLFPFNNGWIAINRTSGDLGKRFIYRNGSGTLTFPRYAGTLAANDTVYADGEGRSAILGSKIYMPIIHDIFLGNVVTMIQSFNGTSCTVERTLESAAAQTISLGGIVEFGDSIYYAYTATSGTIIRIGKYDGTTWTDSFHTIATGLSGAAVEDINEHDGSLYVFTNGKGTYKSAGSDLTSWSDINASADINGLSISVGE